MALEILQRRPEAHVAVVNAASAHSRGGGFLTGGRHALEEALCCASTLFPSLRGLPGDPHLPGDAAALTRGVQLFRTGSDQGYAFVPDPPSVSVISVAFPNLNPQVGARSGRFVHV